jgi:hypothetical protein
MFAAILRASSFVSNFAAERRPIPCYHRPMLPTAGVPDNLPTPTNSFVIFVVLCLFIFGLMAFAKFMQ